ncbi:MAG TPA: hypothetical protein VLA31_09420 [Burkholderiaceae bacterium]|nr:hypothetical protein [Burkholderiaceae bacterium]
MRQINLMAKAWANAEKQHLKIEQGKAFRRRCKAAAEAFLGASHKYERTFSDERTGEFRVMNGAEARDLNMALFRKYIAACDRNVKGRSLEKWKVVERFVIAE